MLLGPQTPTFSWAPPSETVAAADEACDLMARAGQPLDPWQRNVLRLGMGEQPNGQWSAVEVAAFVQRQNGKGGIVEARGIAGLFLIGERLLYYTAHNLDTTKMAFERVVGLVTNMDDLRRRVKAVNQTNSEEGIELTCGSEWRFRTRGRAAQTGANVGKSGGKGRGFTCDCLFCDEALYLQQDAMDALLPTMLARPNPQIWWLSTPPLTAQAAIMKVRADGRAKAPGLAYAEWSNPRNADLNDQAVLAAVNPAYGIRVNEKVLAMLRNRLGEAGFARECGGIWPDDGGLMWELIPEDAWSDRERRGSEITGRLALAVATQRPERSWTAVGACGWNPRGERHIEWSEYRPGTRWVVPWLVDHAPQHNPLVIIVDDKELADQAESAGLKIYRATAGDQVTAAGGLLAGVADPDPRRRDIVHIGQNELTTAAAGAIPRLIGGLWAFDRRDPTVDVSPLVATALAAWGLVTTRIHRVEKAVSMAAVDTGPRRATAAPDIDIDRRRLLEQLQRDLGGGS